MAINLMDMSRAEFITLRWVLDAARERALERQDDTDNG